MQQHQYLDQQQQQNLSSNILAVIPLEDSNVYEQSKSEHVLTEPTSTQKQPQ